MRLPPPPPPSARDISLLLSLLWSPPSYTTTTTFSYSPSFSLGNSIPNLVPPPPIRCTSWRGFLQQKGMVEEEGGRFVKI